MLSSDHAVYCAQWTACSGLHRCPRSTSWTFTMICNWPFSHTFTGRNWHSAWPPVSKSTTLLSLYWKCSLLLPLSSSFTFPIFISHTLFITALTWHGFKVDHKGYCSRWNMGHSHTGFSNTSSQGMAEHTHVTWPRSQSARCHQKLHTSTCLAQEQEPLSSIGCEDYLIYVFDHALSHLGVIKDARRNCTGHPCGHLVIGRSGGGDSGRSHKICSEWSYWPIECLN